MYTMPGLEGKTSKSRLMKKLGVALDPYEKANHRANLNLCVEKKKVDGETVTVAKIESCCYPVPMANGKPSKLPLKEEYTDLSRFSDDLKSIITKVAEQL